jgi:imidazoleglycerol-phosphate dehydratase
LYNDQFMSKNTKSVRFAEVDRETTETDIRLTLDLDGGSKVDVDTGIPFFDHMLHQLGFHGRLDLGIKAAGDTDVDDHHTVEDAGIVLGQALLKALGDKKGVERYGFASVPMDESLARVSVDLSGRPALVFAAAFSEPGAKIGAFDTQLVREFLNALANHGRLNCHVEVPHGENDHHVAEAIFKALGRALRQAVSVTGDQVPSTKGVL